MTKPLSSTAMADNQAQRRAYLASGAAFALISILAAADLALGSPNLRYDLGLRFIQVLATAIALVLLRRGASPLLVSSAGEIAVMTLLGGTAVSSLAAAEPGAVSLLALAIVFGARVFLSFERWSLLRIAAVAALAILSTSSLLTGGAEQFATAAALIGLLGFALTTIVAHRSGAGSKPPASGLDRDAARGDDSGPLRAFAAHSESAREDERGQLARRLHDDVAQPMAALGLRLGHLSRALPRQVGDAAKLRELESMVSSMVATVQTMMTDLRPAILHDFGLTVAVQAEVRAFQHRTGIECDLSIDPDAQCSDDVALATFRLLQDALAHAEQQSARWIDLHLRDSVTTIALEIQHDGERIDRAAIPWNLHCLRQRTLLLGGEFHIESSDESQDRIRLRVPKARPRPIPPAASALTSAIAS